MGQPSHKPIRLAQRTSLIEASGIRKMFELVATMDNPINLSIGQPDFDAPQPVRDAAIKAIQTGKSKYTVTQGLPELNELVLKKYAKNYGFRAEASLITAGVSGAIMLSLLTLLDPGDEILIPDPYFVMYNHLTNLCGGKVVLYDIYPDFHVRAERLASLITPQTKILLLNSPQNPTGAVLQAEELQAIAALAKKHDLLIIADEIYDQFVYDQPYHSICEFYNKVILLGGFSKSYGVPGWRIGYALGPTQVIDTMRTLQQFSYVCAPTPLQYGVLAAGAVKADAWIQGYKEKRDLIYFGLQDHYELIKPQGSFYAFPKLPKGYSEKEFVQKALSHKLLIVPGSAFSTKASHFRISFAVSNEELERGIEVLRKIAS